MKEQKNLSKMQKLTLRIAYDDYKKHPMDTGGKINRIYENGKLVDWEFLENRWQTGGKGGVYVHYLSKYVSKGMVNKRKIFDYEEKKKENYQKMMELKKQHEKGELSREEYHKELEYISLLEKLQRVAPRHKEWITSSFSAAFSRSLRRLRKRGLIQLYCLPTDYGCKKRYVHKVALTEEGGKIAKKIKLSECISKETVNKPVLGDIK